MKTQVKTKKTASTDVVDFALQMSRNPTTLLEFEEAMAEAKRKKEISERIAELRERRGLTQEQVARRVGANLRTYQNWEAGGGTSGENYELLAEILETSHDYLVTGGEHTPPAGDILSRLDQIQTDLAGLVEGQAELDERLAGLQAALGRGPKPVAGDG